jgi:hypothetical protein
MSNKKRKMRFFCIRFRFILALMVMSTFSLASYSQVVLEANGPGETYELINSVLAPGYNVVENPECVHPEFGRHIAEVWDTELNQYVFEFYIHVTPDNDRCINFDRQRMEIKTYDQSPENLIGRYGETVIYKWKFRVPAGFKPSSYFTHIHQIKAVGGDSDDPVFTLTPRKGSPNKLELIHNNLTKVAIVNLSLFEGSWVEATEKIKIDSLHGTYSITIKKVSDGTTVLSYSNNNLMTIRYNNTFIRPKWGIYRSLNNPADLRDEAVRFAGFSIAEESVTGIRDESENELSELSAFPNPAKDVAYIKYNLKKNCCLSMSVYNQAGIRIKTVFSNENQIAGYYTRELDLTGFAKGLYVIHLYSDDHSDTVKLNVVK